MASLIALSEFGKARHSEYVDHKSGIDETQLKILMSRSSTIYVGNLSFSTTETTLYSVFSQFGPIKRIIRGVNKNTLAPCGFCFVEFFDRASALSTIGKSIKIKIDGEIVRCDLDRGYEVGREFGRGASGNQVRDEHKFRGIGRQNPKRQRFNDRR